MPSNARAGAAGSLAVTGLKFAYKNGGATFLALDVALLNVAAGGTLALAGPSGSGKTTLLYALAGIERIASGKIVWGGTDIAGMSEPARDRWRRANVGFVFQDFHLIPGMTIEENVLLPLRFDTVRLRRSDKLRARDLLASVGLHDTHLPVGRLSRGERQRTALARAVIRNPAILIADEPTASLDPAAGARVGELLTALANTTGATLIVASHDPALLARFDRRLELAAGKPVAA